MLTQGALRDKDEWGSEILHVKTDFFFHRRRTDVNIRLYFCFLDSN